MSAEHRMVPLAVRDAFWADALFSSLWSDFEGMTKHFMSGLDVASDHCKTCQCEKKGKSEPHSNGDAENGNVVVEEAASKSKPSKPSFPVRWLLKFFEDEPLAGKWVDDQVVKVKDSDACFEISVAAHDYKPDELKVTVVKNDDAAAAAVLKIEGNHEEKSEDGNKVVSKSFVRQYPLPVDCKPEAVECNVSSDGVLMIHAPKRGQPESDSVKEVPNQKEA